MKDYKHFGIKRRIFPKNNYDALWVNLETTRFDNTPGKEVKPATELPANQSEFYDVSLGTVCTTGKCPFCYVSSDPHGHFYENVSETWKKWMSTFSEKVVVMPLLGKKIPMTVTNKPFQIAIGSQGEPTEHPEFCEFLKTVYETNVVPNYTTNGVILSQDSDLSNKILEYTSNYVGGVAVSFGNDHLRENAKKAVQKLIEKGNCHINIHHIISTKESVDAFVQIWQEYNDAIKYHVLLPLMPSGRSTTGMEDGVFEYLETKIKEHNIKNMAFGAHFAKYLKGSKIKTWLYEPESFSKNVLLKKDHVVITPSSFNMKPKFELTFKEDGSFETIEHEVKSEKQLG